MFIILVSIIITALFLYNKQKKNASEEMSAEAIIYAIKQTEATFPPRIGKSPSDEEIHNSPHIKRIRLALKGYLDGSNDGVEDSALTNELSKDNLKCGLNNFDKSYYKSKFLILSASDNDYGGVQAYIIFVDKPDKIFWAWVYNESSLRVFCEDTSKGNVLNEVKSVIQDGDYPKSLLE